MSDSETGKDAAVATTQPPGGPAIERAKKARQLFGIMSVIAALACLVAAASFFLPYLSATGDARDVLLLWPEEAIDEGLGLTNAQAADISLIEYARVYWYMGETVDSGWYLMTGTVIALGVTTLIALLFAFGKKPFGVLIFSLFSLGIVLLLNWDAEDRNIVDGLPYAWGYGHLVLFIAIGIAIVAAICMAVARAMARHAEKKAAAGTAAQGA